MFRSGLAPGRRAARGAPAPSAFRAFGDGSWIVPPAEVVGAERIRIGAGVVLLEHASITVGDNANLVIDDGTRLARGATIVCASSIEIGAQVSSSDHVTITDCWALLDAPAGSTPPAPQPVVIEPGAYLGFGCVVGPGVRVGRGAYVGEGAVVLRDVLPHTLVRGNPARLAVT